MKIVTIVGVGALGSHLVPLLRNLGVSIRVIDFDRIEQKNVMSQFHAKSSVGKAKVVALQQTLQFLFGLKVQVIPHKLVANNDSQLLSQSDLIVDCLDNGEARRLVQNFARQNKVPCLHGALAADGQFGRSIWDESFQIDDETNAGAATCENGEHLPFISIVSSYMAMSVQIFIEHGKKIGYQIFPGGATRI